jgi:AraC family transcriptional regulator
MLFTHPKESSMVRSALAMPEPSRSVALALSHRPPRAISQPMSCVEEQTEPLTTEDADFLSPDSTMEFSVRQLKDVVNELFTVLHSAIYNEDGSAGQPLVRAAKLLRAIDDRRALTQLPIRGGLAPWAIRKVKVHIESNLDSPIRSEELAAIARLTPCHFIRAFRASFGDSPIAYVIRRRVERAQGLMLSTNEPLSQIAINCGFADQAYLCRLFRRIVGESPAAWRRARLSAPI